jgi:hypothetical protein
MYSLSPEPESDIFESSENLQTLPLLMLAPPPRLQLPQTQSVLFQHGLFSRTLLDDQPLKIQYTCLQPNCIYKPPPQSASAIATTSNLWTHLQRHHKQVYFSVKQTTPSSPSNSSTQSTSTTSFFQPRTPIKPSSKYRDLLLNFVIQNNLALRVVESPSYSTMVQFLNPGTASISTQTLTRDLHKTFAINRHELEMELQRHIQTGARLSLTTDSWSARNYKDFMAVTVHWINDKWQQNSRLLDVVHLKEPIHSGEYLADQLLSVTDNFSITTSIFAITRDNASNNTTMLASYESLSQLKPKTLIQPWGFTVKEGDVCIVISIVTITNNTRSAVLHTLSTLLSKLVLKHLKQHLLNSLNYTELMRILYYYHLIVEVTIQ